MSGFADAGSEGRFPSVLIVHERYAELGGEDESVDADVAAMRIAGLRVESWIVENEQIHSWPTYRKAALLWKTTWSRRSYRHLQELIRGATPDLIHFHNTLPIISPAAIRAAFQSGCGVVMTLSNYRLICPVATLLRNGQPCDDCVTGSLINGIRHACYRGSSLQTAAVAAMIAFHRKIGTWTGCVDAFIALTRAMQTRMTASGLQPEKVFVRGNLVESAPDTRKSPEGFALFLGRLSPEKGINPLLEVCKILSGTRMMIVGDGPLRRNIEERAASLRLSIEVRGYLPLHQAMEVLSRARTLVFPSIWLEPFGRTIVEALARGVPVVAFRIGAAPEILTDGHDGFLVAPGDAAALADRIRLLMTDDALRERMSRNARRTFEERYSPEIAFRKLIEIYRFAMDRAAARRQATR